MQELVNFVTASLHKLEGEAEDLEGKADAAGEQHRASLLGIQQLQETMKEMEVIGATDFVARLLEGHSKKMTDLTAAEAEFRIALDEVTGKILGTQSRLAALEEHLQDLLEGGHGAVLHPHPQPNHVDDIVVEWPQDISLHMQRCSACSEGFPYGDFLFCVCSHVYHPWCAAQWFKATSMCAHTQCGEVHPLWLKSWGFQSCSDKAKETGKDPLEHAHGSSIPTLPAQGPATWQGHGRHVMGTSLSSST